MEQLAVILFIIFIVGGIGYWLGYMEYAFKLDKRRNQQWPSRVATCIECPYCHVGVYGSPDNIDSGLRKHKEFCEEWPDDQSLELF